MANLDQLGLPNGSTYNFKDNTQERSNHRHYGSDTIPLVHKLYESTSYYATSADSWETSSWYFMSIRPDDWYKPWRVKFKVHSYCPSYTNVNSYTWAEYTGRADAIAYANWNEKYANAHYYIPYYPLKKAGFDAGYGHAIGISILYGTGYTTASYYRTFEIDYYECENCTVTILDTPVKWANWTGTGTTNYGSLGAPDACTRGLCETNDANTVTENRIAYFSGKTGPKGIWNGSLFMEDSDGTYQAICTASDGTVTSSNRTTATTKIPNSNGFKVLGTIWYCNTNYNANTNISGSSVVYSAISIFDSRYAFNTTLTANSLTPYKEVYLVGTINSNGLFYLDNPWWTQTPTDPTKVYVLVGACFDSTTSNCRVTLYEQNKWYRYSGSNLIEIANDARTVNGHTVAKDVPSNAVFTDTTYSMTRDGESVKLTPSSGTAQSITLSSLINGLGEGTSQAQANDYLVAQYAGGGTSTTSYHRRKVSNVVNSTVVKAALGTDTSTTTQFLNKKGEWATPVGTTYTGTSPISVSGTTISHANSGATAGTYRSVTVNATGHITAGTNPTTLSGYGITDAKIANGTITLGSSTIKPIPDDATIMSTNPFRSTGAYGTSYSLYISKIDNALYAADKRWAVTCDGWSASSIATLFDGSYETQIPIATNTSKTISFDFGEGFGGYPYGYIYVSFYYTSYPSTITGRVYNTYEPHGVGWHDITFTRAFGSVWVARQSIYGLTKLEITITGGDTNACVTQIEMRLDRPNPARNPFLSKYAAETLYYDLTAPNFIGDLQGNAATATKATQDESGNNIKATYANSFGISDHTITLKNKNGSSLGTVTVPDNNTTYTFANGTNGFTVTPSGGSAQTVTVTPSIANNVTGSGTSSYIAKWNGTNTITNGPAFGSTTTTYLNNAGSWATPPDTKNTAGSTDTSSKIFLVGATSQAANPQTYSDDQVYVTNGVLTSNTTATTILGITATNGTSGGISLYSGPNYVANYGIAMRTTANSGKHGYVQGDWAHYFYMDGATNRGLVFKQAGTAVASVSGLGNAVFNGSVTIGGNTTNTSGARLVYDANTQAINFEFL